MGKCMAVLAVAATAIAACKRQPVNATNAAGEYAAAKPRPDTIQLQATLDSAFSKRSYKSLAFFFDNWNKRVTPNNSVQKGEDSVVKAVYDVFRVFYDPAEFYTLNDIKRKRLLQQFKHYCIIQNSIRYEVTDEWEEYGVVAARSELREIADFRPEVNMPSQQVLYLLPEYDTVLRRFLKKAVVLRRGQKPKMFDNADSVKAGVERYEAIRSFIPSVERRRHSYWQLESYPGVKFIRLIGKLTKAAVYCYLDWYGGVITLERKGSAWVFKEYKSSGIE